jgi:hypothetical protein
MHLLLIYGPFTEMKLSPLSLATGGAADAGDYKEIKQECEPKIARLEAQLAEQTNNIAGPASVDKLLHQVIFTHAKSTKSCSKSFSWCFVLKRFGGSSLRLRAARIFI